MYFVQYFQKSAINENKLVESCGDRGVFILDGRNSISTMRQDARNFNSKLIHKWNAFVIYKGENLIRNCQSLTDIIPL